MNAPFASADFAPEPAAPPTPELAPEPANTSTRLHGVVRMGQAYVAVNIEHIREVVPRPPVLASFPKGGDGLANWVLGALELRGAIVPVLDLAGFMGVAGGPEPTSDMAPTAGEILLLLRIEGRVLGVVVHEICGVMELREKHCTPIQSAAGQEGGGGQTGGAGLVACGFAIGGRSGVVLNMGVLGRWPGLAMAQERNVARQDAAELGQPYLMFAAGGYHFGLAAEMIEACVPRRVLGPSAVDDALWIGRIAHGGRRVPVVDTLELLGLGQMEPARECASVILRMPEGRRLALRIDHVANILRLPATALLPLQGFAVGRAHVLCGMHEGEVLSLIIDGAGLQAEEALRDLAGMEEAEGEALADLLRAGSRLESSGPALGQSLSVPADPVHADPAYLAKPFLLVRAGAGQFAVPLDQIE